MKKLLFAFVAVAAMSFASCGNKAAEAPATDSVADSAAVEDTTATDSATADSATVEVAADSANA